MGQTKREDMVGETYARSWPRRFAQRAGTMGPGAVGSRSILVEPRS